MAVVLARPSESEETRLRRRLPELRTLAHTRTRYGEEWLLDGRTSWRALVRRLTLLLEDRPGWTNEGPGEALEFDVWNFDPGQAPTWHRRVPLLCDGRRHVGITLEPGRWSRGGDPPTSAGWVKAKLWTFDEDYPDEEFPDIPGWK